MLDSEIDEIGDEHLDSYDWNSYTYGLIGDHRAVVTCLPEGYYRITDTARVARDVSRYFPNVRFCLMAGIGGGAPTEDNDIRLGDVVVGFPDRSCSGLVQYEYGKELPDGGYVQTGQLDAPLEVLLGAIRKMRRLYNDPQKPDRIAEHIKRMDDYHPGYMLPAEDQSYQSDYRHQGANGATTYVTMTCLSHVLIEISPTGRYEFTMEPSYQHATKSETRRSEIDMPRILRSMSWALIRKLQVWRMRCHV